MDFECNANDLLDLDEDEMRKLNPTSSSSSKVEANQFRPRELSFSYDVNQFPGQLPDDFLYANGAAGINGIENKNYLLMKIPEDMQMNKAFDSLPYFQLPKNVLKKVHRAADGHDGVFLSITEEAPQVAEEIVRPPLQLIQFVNFEDQQSSPASKNKRKQNFDTSREDGIEFVDDLVSSEPKLWLEDDDLFNWAKTVDVMPRKAPKLSIGQVNDSKRCPGCKKTFKKLPHKCKKLPLEVDFMMSPMTYSDFELSPMKEEPDFMMSPAKGVADQGLDKIETVTA